MTDSIQDSNLSDAYEFYRNSKNLIDKTINELSPEIKNKLGQKDIISLDELEKNTSVFTEEQKETLVNDYLNILAYHYEFDADNRIPQQKTIEIKKLLTELATLVVVKSPTETIYKQIEKLDALWEVKKDSHNGNIEDQINALTILLDNEINAYKENEPGSSLGRIAKLENEINALRNSLI